MVANKLRCVLSEEEAAAYLSLSAGHLRRMRSQGRSPEYIRLGERRIGYRQLDLDAWVSSRVSGATQPMAA
jgi:predicted DNA-binding transcriptional regulator AlpA